MATRSKNPDAPLAVWFRTNRKAAGWTQGELATRLGTTQPTVQRWEQGEIKLLGGDLLSVAYEQFSRAGTNPAIPPINDKTCPVVGAILHESNIKMKKEPLEEVPLPPGLAGVPLVAYRIETDAFEPAYERGDLIFTAATKTPGVDPANVGKLCVVALPKRAGVLFGRVRVAPGGNGYVLQRINGEPVEFLQATWSERMLDHRPA